MYRRLWMMIVMPLALVCITGVPDAVSAQNEALITNQDLVLRWIVEFYNAGNMSVGAEILHEDFVMHESTTFFDQPLSRHQSTGWITALHNLWPDIAQLPDVEDGPYTMILAGEFVAYHFVLTATSIHNYDGYPHHGPAVSVPAVGLVRLMDGKIIEVWLEYNGDAFADQLFEERCVVRNQTCPI